MERDTRRRDKFAHSSKKSSRKKYLSQETNQRIEVWNDTLQLCSRYKGSGVLVDFSDIPTPEPCGENVPPKCLIKNMDTLECASEYYWSTESCYKILVLNMASSAIPGGGVSKGKSAQEEEIFRRTNAVTGHPHSFYPLGDIEAVYMKNALILKDQNNSKLDHPIPISIISCPAIRRPKLYKEKYKPRDYNLMEIKIEGLFKLALVEKFDVVVFGALGCGVYSNPPRQVAEIFAQSVLKYPQLKVIFAILDTPPHNNLQIFKDVFKKFDIQIK